MKTGPRINAIEMGLNHVQHVQNFVILPNDELLIRERKVSSSFLPPPPLHVRNKTYS